MNTTIDLKPAKIFQENNRLMNSYTRTTTGGFNFYNSGASDEQYGALIGNAKAGLVKIESGRRFHQVLHEKGLVNPTKEMFMQKKPKRNHWSNAVKYMVEESPFKNYK